MEFKDKDLEFRLISEDLNILFDKAESIRDRISRADDDEVEELCAKFAVLKECIIEGTEYLQNRIFALDRFCDYKVSEIGKEGAKGTTIAEAMEDEDFIFKSDSMSGYRFFRDKYEED